MADGDQPDSSQLRRTRCVVLHAGEEPVRLIDALLARGLDVVATPSALVACAQALIPPAGEPRVVVFVEPKRLEQAIEIELTLRRFAPDSRRWVYLPGDTDELRPARDDDFVPTKPAIWDPGERAARPRQTRSAGTGLRLAGDGPWHSSPTSDQPDEPAERTARTSEVKLGKTAGRTTGFSDVAASGSAAGRAPLTPRALLTDDELAMLLADED
ncbi:MAG: hypothetical protein AAF747_08660 [Planctomycetota bacterium]